MEYFLEEVEPELRRILGEKIKEIQRLKCENIQLRRSLRQFESPTEISIPAVMGKAYERPEFVISDE